MSKPFTIGQGNTPKIVDTLANENGVLDLTGMTAQFIIQGEGGVSFTRAATVENAALGQVSYQFVSADSASPGDYLAQWSLATAASPPVIQTFPSDGYLRFTVQPGLPFTLPTALARLSDYFDDVRAVTGDHKARRYEDAAIERVMRVVLRGGRVPITAPGRPHRWDGDQADAGGFGLSYEGPPLGLGHQSGHYQLGADRRSITPPIPNTDVKAYLLLVYHTAKLLLLPNVKAMSYRTRAVSERFGEQTEFLVELENVLFELENGTQCYTEVRGLRAWVFSLAGLVQNSALLIPGDIMPSTIFL